MSGFYPLPLNVSAYHWRRWTSVLGQFAVLQLLVQGLTAVTGLLLVRQLDKTEYALFTLASTISATLSVLSDSGVSACTLSIGGEVWQNKPRLLRLVREGVQMRSRVGLWSLAFVGPIAFWLLVRSQAPAWQAATLTIISILVYWPVAATQIASTALRLHSSFRELQVSEMLVASFRLLLTSLLLFFSALSSITALLAVLAAVWMQWRYIRKKEDSLLGSAMDADVTFKPRLTQSVRHMLPNSCFTCIQSSLVTWLLAALATNSEVADLGALSRLAVLFVIIASPLHQVVTPAFARCKDTFHLRRLFLITVCGFAGFATAVVVLCWIWPTGPLWLLGAQYESLNKELPIYMLGLGIAGISNVFWALNFSRGWLKRVSWNIPASVVSTLIAIGICDLSSVSGAAVFTCISPLGSLFLGGAVALQGLK